jgi:hypothetical protein
MLARLATLFLAMDGDIDIHPLTEHEFFHLSRMVISSMILLVPLLGDWQNHGSCRNRSVKQDIFNIYRIGCAIVVVRMHHPGPFSPSENQSFRLLQNELYSPSGVTVAELPSAFDFFRDTVFDQ